MRVLNASRMSRRSGLAVFTSAVVALGFSALVAAPPAAASPPGWLDRTYGTNGWGAAGAFSVAPAAGAVDSSGRAVEIVDNHTNQQAVTRLTVDGAVDQTFGTSGTTALPGTAAYGQVLVGSDGIYLLEEAGTGRTASALAKLTPDGLLDSSFGVGGIASVAFSGFPAGALTKLVQLTDGTIIVAGDNAIAAIDSSGDLDATWNAAGAVPGVLPGVGAVSGLTADGNKVVATIGGSAPQLRRWLRTGAPDGGLGSAGVATLTAGTYDGVFTGPDGDYYVTARTGASGYRPRVVGRFLPGGTVDSSYGTAGFTRMPVQDNTSQSARIAFHGTDAYLFSSYGVGDPDVARITTTGALDPAFGAGGLVELMKSDLPTGGQLPHLVGGGLQPDGRVVVLLGYVGPSGNGASIGAVRLNASTIALAGSFVPLVPARLLDTRYGLGAPIGRVGSGLTVHLQVGDRGGVPELGAASVVLNLTAVLPSASGHVTVFPTGQGRPRSSSLNFEPGQTTANVVTVALGAGGQVTMTNSSSGSTDLLADVVGYYLAGTPTVAGAFVAVPQTRLLDTRVGRGAPQAPVAKGAVLPVSVAGLGGVPMTNVSSVLINVTVTNAKGAGYVTVYPSGVARPTASTLNHAAGETRANLVTVTLGADGKVDLFNGANATIDLVVDLAGYYIGGTATSPGTFVAVNPVRVLDTRTGNGVTRRPVHAGSDIQFFATGSSTVPAGGASAVLLNATATGATRGGQLTVMGADVGWPGNPWDYVHNRPSTTLAYPRYPTSTVNFRAGQNVANLAFVTGSTLALVHNGSSGGVDVVADLAGYFNP
jgi:Domain of unknown function (DUF5122) beta-propeller